MRLGETYIVARNVVRVFADSSRLGDILEAGEIVSRRHFEAEAARLRMTASGRRFLSERRELHSSDVDQTKLRALPVGTVGRAYIDHLDRHGLSMDAICAPAVQPGDSDARYLLRRFRGNHDIWHALLDLGIAGHEEVLVHAFSWGQLRLPQSALVVFFGGIKHVVGERRWHVLRHDIARYAALGRRAASLLEERWEDCWDEPLVSARARLGLDELESNRSCTPATRVEHIAKSSNVAFPRTLLGHRLTTPWRQVGSRLLAGHAAHSTSGAVVHMPCDAGAGSEQSDTANSRRPAKGPMVI